MMKAISMSAAAALFASTAMAQETGDWRYGPIFEEFGPHVPVPGYENFPLDTEFSVAFDVAQEADEGSRNRGFESAARFINMHASHGVDPERMRLAVVVHGGAVKDLIDSEDNTSRSMVTQLLDYGVRFIVCGQSAGGQGITAEQLIEGVEMELSAMTAHAKLQQRGYTVNPF